MAPRVAMFPMQPLLTAALLQLYLQIKPNGSYLIAVRLFKIASRLIIIEVHVVYEIDLYPMFENAIDLILTLFYYTTVSALNRKRMSYRF